MTVATQDLELIKQASLIVSRADDDDIVDDDEDDEDDLDKEGFSIDEGDEDEAKSGGDTEPEEE